MHKTHGDPETRRRSVGQRTHRGGKKMTVCRILWGALSFIGRVKCRRLGSGGNKKTRAHTHAQYFPHCLLCQHQPNRLVTPESEVHPMAGVGGLLGADNASLWDATEPN